MELGQSTQTKNLICNSQTLHSFKKCTWLGKSSATNMHNEKGSFQPQSSYRISHVYVIFSEVPDHSTICCTVIPGQYMSKAAIEHVHASLVGGGEHSVALQTPPILL